MPISTLTSSDQAAIPKSIQEALHLKPGDRLEFVIGAEGQVILRSVSDVDLTDLDGLLDRSDLPPVSIEEMQRVIEQRARESFRQDS